LDKQKSICIGKDTFLSEETSEMLLEDLENKFGHKFDIRDAEKYIKDNRLELVIKRPNPDVSFPHLGLCVRPSEYWLAQRKDNGEYKYFHELYFGKNNEVARQFLTNEGDDKMSDWLSTGEMIDRLKYGETAESDGYWEVRKLDNGEIVELNEGHNVTLEASFIHNRWKITPNYVPFEDVIEQLRDGGTATFHDNNGEKHTIGIDGCIDWARRFTWRKLIEGKWTI